MKVSYAIAIGSLLCAIVLIVVAESRGPRSGERLAWATLFALYCVCVGMVSSLLVFFFGLGELAALAISVPLGVLALLLFVKMSEV